MGAKTPEQRARAKRADYLRAHGRPLNVTEAELEEARIHCTRLYNRGMSYQGIAETAPAYVSSTTVAKVIKGWRETIHRDTYESLMQTYYVQPTGWRAGRHMDPTGLRRRMRGLVANGFGYTTLGPVLGVSPQAVFQLCVREVPVFASAYGVVVPVYEKLECGDPYEYGATPLGVSRAKGTAGRRGWVPTTCWDPDTIDDPAAFPEWTGACGTPEGYYLHLKDGVRVLIDEGPRKGLRRTVLCQPCVSARAEAEGITTVTDTEGIIEALRGGGKYRDIADQCGVSTRTIQRVAIELKKTGWRPHRTGPRSANKEE